MEWCEKLGILSVGLDNGQVHVFNVTFPKDNSPAQINTQFELKVHSKRVMGLATDFRKRVIYSIGEDGILAKTSTDREEVMSSIFFCLNFRKCCLREQAYLHEP